MNLKSLVPTCLVAWALTANAQSPDVPKISDITPEIVDVLNPAWNDSSAVKLDSVDVNDSKQENNKEKSSEHNVKYSISAELLSKLYNSQIFQLFSNNSWWHIAVSWESQLNKNTNFFISSDLYAAYDKNNQSSIDNFTDIGATFTYKWISLTLWFEWDRYPKWTTDMGSFNVLWGFSYNNDKLNVNSVVFKPLLTLAGNRIEGVWLSNTVSYNTAKINALIRAWTVCHEEWKTQFAVWVHYLLRENFLLKVESIPRGVWDTWDVLVSIMFTFWN